MKPEKVKKLMEQAGANNQRCELETCPFFGEPFLWSKRHNSYMCPSALSPEERSEQGYYK